jgi:hypothetical protein
MVIAADRKTLDFLASDKRWRETQGEKDARPWTDDYSNIFGVIVW